MFESKMQASDNSLGPVTIKSVDDIRRVIKPFINDIKEDKVEISSSVSWEEDGKKDSAIVSAYSSDISMRKQLLDGFDQVREQKKAWDSIRIALQDDEYGSQLPAVDIDDFLMPVDRIIKHRLGGKREGFTIVWHINNSKIVFKPYEKTLEVADG